MFGFVPLKQKDLFKLIAAVVVLIVMYLLVRSLFLNSLPVFVDEAIYIRWSQVMRAEPTLRFLPLQDGKQPLYMWLTIPFLKLISDPLVAGRLVSVLAGLGTMIGVGILAVLATGVWVWGLVAAGVYLLLPFAHFFDRMALADGLLAFFGIWSLVLGYLLVRLRRLDLAMILGFVLGGAVLTKTPGWLFLFLQPSLLLTSDIFSWSKGRLKADWKALAALVLLWLVAGGIAFGLYNILRLGPNFHMIAIRNRDYVFPLNEIAMHPFNPLVGNLKDTLSWLANLLTLPGMLLLLVSLVKPRRLTLVLWFWLVLPLVAQALVAKAYTSRYFFYVVPWMALLMAFGLKWLWEKKHELAWIIGGLFVAWGMYYNFLLSTNPAAAPMPQNMAHGYLQEWTAGWGQREVAAYLVGRTKEHKVVVGTEGFFGTLPDGLQIYTEKVPNITIFGVGVVLDKTPQPLIDALKENEVYLVINQSRNKISEDILNERFELIAQYPKPPRPDGTREVLQFFRLVR